jgi:hypothetical protein
VRLRYFGPRPLVEDDSVRSAATTIVNLDAGYKVSERLRLIVDVFNLLNSNTAINLNWRSGASFEKATTVLNPRIAKFGVKFNW